MGGGGGEGGVSTRFGADCSLSVSIEGTLVSNLSGKVYENCPSISHFVPQILSPPFSMASFRVNRSHWRKPGIGDSVENCEMFGNSWRSSSTTCLIRKLPRSTPLRPGNEHRKILTSLPLGSSSDFIRKLAESQRSTLLWLYLTSLPLVAAFVTMALKLGESGKVAKAVSLEEELEEELIYENC